MAEAAGIPVMPWKKHPQRGSLLAQVIDTDGAPADGASVTIKQIIGWPGQAPIAQTADGNGYSGATDLPLGLYQLIITTPEGTFRTLIPRLVLPGYVNRFAVRLGWRPRGPMLRTSAGHVRRRRVFGADRARRAGRRRLAARTVARPGADRRRHPRTAARKRAAAAVIHARGLLEG